jgi:hypothetical protein
MSKHLNQSDQFLLCFRGPGGCDDKKSQNGRNSPQRLVGEFDPQRWGIRKTCLHIDLAQLDSPAVLGGEAPTDTTAVPLTVCPKRPETHTQDPEETLDNTQTGELHR